MCSGVFLHSLQQQCGCWLAAVCWCIAGWSGSLVVFQADSTGWCVSSVGMQASGCRCLLKYAAHLVGLVAARDPCLLAQSFNPVLQLRQDGWLEAAASSSVGSGWKKRGGRLGACVFVWRGGRVVGGGLSCCVCVCVRVCVHACVHCVAA
jgi:hypothetical protein